MPALKKKLIFAQVLKVVGPNQGIKTHLMKHYLFGDGSDVSAGDELAEH